LKFVNCVFAHTFSFKCFVSSIYILCKSVPHMFLSSIYKLL
jgi:hypothetical protein